MRVCKKCGSPLRDGDVFCPKCGRRCGDSRRQERKEKAEKKKQEKEITFRTKPERGANYREHFEEDESRKKALFVTITGLVVLLAAAACLVVVYFFIRRNANSGAQSSGAVEILSEGQVQDAGGVQGEVPDAPQTGAADDIAIAGDDAQSADAAQGEGTQSADAAQGEGTQSADAAQGEGTQSADAAQGEGTQSADAAQGGTPAQDEAGGQGETPAPEEVQAAAAAVQTEAAAEPAAETETDPPKETERQTPAASDVIDPAEIQTIVASDSNASAAEIYIYDLKHDSEAAVNNCDEPMYASALITVPILYTAASKIDAGELSPDTPITYVSSIGGRGEVTTEARESLEFPLSFYLQTMVRYSDNNCINILIDYFGLDTINAVCQNAGYTSVNLERKMVAAGTGGLDNYISAKDLTMMVRDLYTGKFKTIDAAFMQEYFRIYEYDGLPTVIGRAPSLADAEQFLNQNGYGSTRYNEIAVIKDNGAEYILTVMLYGGDLIYDSAVCNTAEYVNNAMTQ